MNNEDKRVIADYLGLIFSPSSLSLYEHKENGREFHFDLDDAGLCVKEMQKHGDWEHDFMDFVAGSQRWNYHQCIAWLFNADNFFEVMAKWLKEEKK